jgi:hypothetical protein
MFDVIDKIEDWLFGVEATVSPGGWSCNSCTATALGDGVYIDENGIMRGPNQSPIIN